MKITLLKSLLLLGAFVCFGAVQAQTVTGTVSDASGPLPGASVVVKGTTNGTQTDFDGNYTLDGVDSNATLVFSYIGYATQEVAVNGQTTISVTLQEDAQALDEVVIIGYGQTTVKDATGAVASVTSEDFNGGVIASPEQLIQGKTAGVQITQSSGEPGAGIALRIRGAGSVRANNSPLFVVDGIPLSNEAVTADGSDVGAGTGGARNPLNFLNPNDIESMSILKDASATAIYGSRGANGVVIITTKSGKGGGNQGTFSFSSNLSISTVAETLDLLSADEFRERGGADLGGSTDWQDFIFRTAASTDNNFSYARNYGKGNIRATFGYAKQFGIIEDTDLERVTGRINANHRFFDDKLRVGIQASISRINDNAPFISRTSGSTGDLLSAAYYSNPTLTANPSLDVAPDRNPANLLTFYEDITNTDRFLGNLSLDYTFTDELSAKLNLGLDISDSQRGQAVGPQILGFDNGAPNNGRAAVSNLDTENKLIELTVNYKKDFGNVRLDALAGYSFQDFNRRGSDLTGFGYGTSNLNEIIDLTHQAFLDTQGNVGSFQSYAIGQIIGGPADTRQLSVASLFPREVRTLDAPTIPISAFTVDTFDNTDELQSFFARANVTINDKYLFTATMRADGSTRFGENNRYGYFPSAAFAWQLNQEDFISEETFSTLKLRLNWGITGNQDGLGYGNFALRQRYIQSDRISGYRIENDGSIRLPGLESVAFENPDLQWEENTQYGLGIDFGFANDRLTGTIDLYRKETRDFLLQTPPLQGSNAPFAFGNVDGVIINQGIEFGLDYDIIQTADLVWNANFNVAYNDNELTDYDGVPIQAGQLYGPGLSDATSQIIADGQSLFTYFLRNVDENNVVDADPSIQDKSGLPDITAGFSTDVSYKNWSASMFFSGQFGHYVYNNTQNALFALPQIGSRNNLKSVVDNGVTLSNTNPSTAFLEKGDFIRLQSATVAYNVPLNGNGTLKSLRLSVNGQNLFLITDYSGIDPEVSTSDAPDGFPSTSIDYLQYPRPRTFTFGLNATF